MVSPREIIAVMKAYQCNANEAYQFLMSPVDNHFIFSSGAVYIAPNNF